MNTGDLSQSDNPRLAYTDGPSRSKPSKLKLDKRRLPRLPNFQWHSVVLLHCVILTSQYCTEYFEPSSPVVSTSLQYLFSTQIGIGLAVMLTMMLLLPGVVLGD